MAADAMCRCTLAADHLENPIGDSNSTRGQPIEHSEGVPRFALRLPLCAFVSVTRSTVLRCPAALLQRQPFLVAGRWPALDSLSARKKCAILGSLPQVVEGAS